MFLWVLETAQMRRPIEGEAQHHSRLHVAQKDLKFSRARLGEE